MNNYKENALFILNKNIPFLVFFITLIIHLFASIWNNIEVLQNMGMQSINYISLYTDTVGQYRGLSLALSLSYISYLTIKFFETKDNGIIYILKGLIISISIFFILTFSLGYYNNFIEEYFISKIGWIFIPIRKRVLLFIVIISIIPGFIYCKNKLKK